ncbi:MAG: FAD-binding oxidoreductase [Chloroflexota bacterium]
MVIQTTYSFDLNAIITDLHSILRDDQISINETVRETHSHDWSRHTPSLPDVVVWAESTADVAAVVKLANTHRVPITAWGAGTSLEGNPIPVYKGITLSLSRMTAISAVYPADFQATAQAGITHEALNAELQAHDLFFAPVPGANSTLGGILANNASGTRTVRYGAAKDNVLQMTVVMASGEIIRIGSRSVKQSSGYNLLNLIVGSEGTLGIVTEATVRLFPLEKFRSTALVSFETTQQAIDAVVGIRTRGLTPKSLEFVGEKYAGILWDAVGIDRKPIPTLFIEFGSFREDVLEAELEIVKTVSEGLNAQHIELTTDPEKCDELWLVRRKAYNHFQAKYEGKSLYVTDVAVPISALPQMVARIHELMNKNGIDGVVLGHAGDGNVHATMPYDDEAGFAAVKRVNAGLIATALELGGTATGEHGVGIGKVAHMEQEHGSAVAVMRAIKQTLDPNNILNPGKVFP